MTKQEAQELFEELAKELQTSFAITDLEDEDLEDDLASDGSPRVLDAATKGRQEWKEPNAYLVRRTDGEVVRVVVPGKD